MPGECVGEILFYFSCSTFGKGCITVALSVCSWNHQQILVFRSGHSGGYVGHEEFAQVVWNKVIYWLVNQHQHFVLSPVSDWRSVKVIQDGCNMGLLVHVCRGHSESCCVLKAQQLSQAS